MYQLYSLICSGVFEVRMDGCEFCWKTWLVMGDGAGDSRCGFCAFDHFVPSGYMRL